MKGKNKQIRINESLHNDFIKQYPEVEKLFLDRCLFLALQDRKFFEDVFFNPLFVEVK